MSLRLQALVALQVALGAPNSLLLALPRTAPGKRCNFAKGGFLRVGRLVSDGSNGYETPLIVKNHGLPKMMLRERRSFRDSRLDDFSASKRRIPGYRI